MPETQVGASVSAEKAITLGHPSYIWRGGQERRLNLMRRYVPLEGMTILDIGCGIGTYVKRFQDFSDRVFGFDVDAPRVHEGAGHCTGLAIAVGEHMPYANGSVDVVMLNEVIEHVTDDAATMREVFRILKPGGSVVIYAPNRLYFFETHGVYLGKKYVFGNIPLVNWLPNPVRNRLVPHARAYTAGGIRKITDGLPFERAKKGYVYPGFDNVVRRHRRVGPWIKRFFQFCEQTPLQYLGLSHFLVLRKPDDRIA